ncbi:MAG: adenylate kinase [Acidobacteria bacterium]|nr:MAG: adenylate kinase [Acidobacteriota bacterium]REK03025.1 MAG: adenylate kinase [Acidobacteriota bacterium]REK13171.1 MAG: adenylate kinase [Acidobacteriota bacterium]REK41165.1 MAG: adenylate kinase [Acidobacteriota bacterium]
MRISVVGSSCSGKTTFSRRLSEITSVKHVPIDEYSHLPDWQERSTEELREMIGREASRDEWIIDGNYTRTRDLVWPRVTLVIWLDLPFRVVYARTIWRTTSRVVTRERVCAGNRERFWRSFFTTDSMIYYVARTFWYRRRRIEGLLKEPQYSSIPYVRLKSTKDVREYLRGVEKVF